MKIGIFSKSALIFVAVISLFTPFQTYADTGVPSIVSYRGYLADTGGNALGGTGTNYYFKFSLWDNPAVGSGSKVWPSSSPGVTTLSVKRGYFNANIGDTTNGYPDALNYDFNTNSKVYLQIEVSSDNVTYETLSPRSLITSSAFAQVASQVNGTGSSSFGTTTPFASTVISAIASTVNHTVLAIKGLAGQVADLFTIKDSSNNSLFTVTASGNVGIGTTTPGASLAIGSSTYGLLIGAGELPSNTYNFIQGPAVATAGSTLFSVKSNGSLGGGGSIFVAQTSGGSGIRVSETGVLYASDLIVMSGNSTIDMGGIGNNNYFRTSNSTQNVTDFTFNGGKGADRTAGYLFKIQNHAIDKFVVDYVGNVGIGTTTPAAKFAVAGNSYLGGTLVATGTVQLSNFGAGTLTTDANGNVGVSSDERLKNIKGFFNTGLSAIEALKPITFNWKPETGLDTENDYTGFSAQNVQTVIPEAVSTDKHGNLTLQDRPILATLVNAVKEISSSLVRWITFRNDNLCVDDVCVTKEQFKQILINNGGTGYSAPAPSVQQSVQIPDPSETTVATSTNSVNNETISTETSTSTATSTESTSDSADLVDDTSTSTDTIIDEVVQEPTVEVPSIVDSGVDTILTDTASSTQ